MGMLGCDADGKNIECRLCGAGAYSSVPCPPSSCHFPNEPVVPYYWDNECEMGKLGCWADGIHAQCRFCGEHPYTNITCPDVVARPPATACAFVNEPETPYFWDPECSEGMRGCLADGVHVGCRFCGEGSYADIPCPSRDTCTFANEPLVPYYWEHQCKPGMLGCMADGIHAKCRFCESRPFEDIPCPSTVAPASGSCTWAGGVEPETSFFWDESCKMGHLGCWADGLHAQCRFCGTGVFRDVPCPGESRATGGAGAASSARDQDLPRAGAFRADAGAAERAAEGGLAKDLKAAGEGEQGDEEEDVPLSGTRRVAVRIGDLACLLHLAAFVLSFLCVA